MLFGRHVETERIGRLVQDARQGRSRVLVLRGEAGIGKTALLRRGADTAREHGMRVLWLRGWEPEKHLAFAGLSQLVRSTAHLIVRLPAAQAEALRGAVALGPTRPADRFGVCAATLSLLAELAEERPLLLAVDDLHALDPSSAEALAFAARRLMAEDIGMLVTARPDPAADSLTVALPVLEVAALAENAVGELVANRTGVRPHEDVRRRLALGSAGNPMALIELVNGLTSHQLSGRHPMPRSVQAGATAGALFADRVAAVGASARTLLLLMASSTSTEGRDVARAARELGVPRTAFAEVEDSGLASFASNAYHFVHPLVPAAVLAAAPSEERLAVHRALAAAYVQPGRAGERAWHLSEATLGPDEQVAVAIEDLARTAEARSGYVAAAAAWERSAELSVNEPDRARRLTAAAKAALLGGRSTHARDLLVSADTLVGEAGLRAEIAAGLGRVELFTGHPALARRFVFQAAEEFSDTHPLRSSELFADAAVASLLSGDPAGAFDAATRAEKLLDGAQSRATLVTGLIRGITLLHLGQGGAGREQLRGCLAAVRRTRDGQLPTEYVILAAATMNWTGEHLLGRRVINTLLGQLRASGAMGMLPFALYVSSYADVFTGRMEAARAAATEAVELAAFTDNEFWQYLSLSALAHVEAVRGDAEICREHGQQALALRRADSDYPRDASEALALLELSLGDYPEALRRLREGTMSTLADDPDSLVDSNFDAIEARIRGGLPLPERSLASLAEHAGQVHLPLHAAIALRLHGLAADGGAEDCFGDFFEQALALHAEAPCPLETSRTRLAYGERLRRAGQRVRAREQLRAALDGFERLGAQVWADRCRRELTATGETVRARSAPSGPEGLTPQEFRVAQAVVRGATNKQAASALFLSPKTVEFHLGNVYHKLGVRNRTELAHQCAELRE
ncbi:AAA family ATPase [Streptomyces sp. NPDC088360]|uniref:helix-turn-helix transcriptional regulator n=1 Tax=Streptomyces sp. NPDC088360 TaxID=3154515 RepID=UPI00344BAFFE